MVTKSILLVEDDEDIRSAIAEFLTLEGYPVSTAQNGREALDQLERAPHPALILLDLMMPVMSGLQFLQAQSQDPRISKLPVVVVSAVADKSSVPKDLVRGFVRKPIDLELLLSFITTYCGAPS